MLSIGTPALESELKMATVSAKKRLLDLLSKPKSETGEYGLPDIVANTDNIISEILGEAGYSAAELTEIIQWFAGLGKISALPAYPHRVQQLPAVFVYRSDDSEIDGGPLGDYFGVDTDKSDDSQTTHIYGVMNDERLSINIWAMGEPTYRDHLYLIVKELVLRGRLWFSEIDVMIAEWRNGKDGLLYDRDAEPQIIHRATAVLVCKTVTTWPESVARIRQIRSRFKQRLFWFVKL